MYNFTDCSASWFGVKSGSQEENFIIHFWILVKIKMLSFCVKLVYLVVITVQLASQQSIYYVTPGNGTRSDSTDETVCHPGNTQCSTLTDLSQRIVEHQYSNHSSCLLDTRIVLLPGIHNISADSNTLFNVNCSENLVFTALDPQVGATIRCKGSTGFAFNHAINLSIRGLTFENCGFLSTQHLWFISLSVDKAMDIDINNVVIRGSREIGLYIGNSHGTITIVKLHLQNNPSHFYFLMDENQHADPGHVTDEKTYLTMESCSIFHGGKEFGLRIYIVQRTYKVKMQLRNVRVYQNRNSAIDIKLNEMCNSIITIDNLTVTESIDSFIVLHSRQLNCKTFTATVKIDRAHFKDCGFSIYTPGSLDTSEPVANHTLTIANTLVQRSRQRMGWKYAGSVIIQNVTIENCTGDREYFGLGLMISKLIVKGSFTFRRNTGGICIFTCATGNSQGGYIELSTGSKVVIDDNTIPSYTYGGSAVNIRNSRITVFGGSSLTLNGNTGIQSGGLLLRNSKIIFQGKEEVIQCIFSHNRGSSGGALAFYDKSVMTFYGNQTSIYFIRNHATMYGGAIYVDDTNYIERLGDYTYIMMEFIQRIGSSLMYPAPLFFINNTAEVAGNTLFGGRVDKGLVFLVNTEDDPSNIASEPTRVCPCEKSVPNCNLTSIMVKRYPGERYEFEAVAVGQKLGTIPSIVQAQITFADNNFGHVANDIGKLETTEYTQLTKRSCTKLSYTMKSPPQLYHNITIHTVNYDSQTIEALKSIFKFQLSADMIKVLLTQFNLTFYSKHCPYGFLFDETTKECICQKALLDQGIHCNSRSYDVLKPSHKWVNITSEHHVNYYANNMSGPGVLIYDHCPYDFCKILPNPLPLSLYHPDDQCNYNRSGILCGSCKTNFSLTLGSSVCQKCSKPWTAPVITISIAFAGLLLVVFLMFFNFTVSMGTINGLIFYVNIVQANKTFFFPNDASKSFLSVFIAWLNLDLGIETCLYDGMDAYAKTWLQFLFPAYIWAIVIIIIVSSHYSTAISRLSGNNAVQVLATLFLLSYAKLLRVSITIFSSAVLVYPGDYRRRVWLYDGNVDYLQGKHIPLFVTGLLLLLLISIPYTTVLLTIQWLQRFPGSWKICMCIAKLHPLFDAYTGPFKFRHRYWTGLLLMTRVFLFLVFSLNSANDPSVNQLTIAVSMLCLLAYLALVGGVYKQWPLSLLEIVFLSNLGILSAACGIYQEDSARLITAQVSTGTTFVLFGAIIVYHLVLRVLQSRAGRALKNYVGEKREIKRTKKEEGEPTQALSDSDDVTVTHSVVDLQELLLK